jgi:hypothetical protein
LLARNRRVGWSSLLVGKDRGQVVLADPASSGGAEGLVDGCGVELGDGGRFGPLRSVP